MQSRVSENPELTNHSSSAVIVLREAKRLHRIAKSGSLSSSLPLLRRLLSAGVLRDTTLPEAFRARSGLQRKHFLRLLAIEAGFSSWEKYRPALSSIQPSELDSFIVLEKGWAFIHDWFPSEEHAQAQVDKVGGRVLRIGRHAVALTVQQAEQHYQF
ncbi:MAG: hypothetical protein V4812_11920 [Pseudomonadota bacterium]